MAKIDEINGKILSELSADGRISNTELAERVGLSASACLRRVQELERSGVIQGYRAVINRSVLGVGFLAYIGIGLSDHSKKNRLAFEGAMGKAPEVRECHKVAGNYAYVLRVEVPDINAFNQFHSLVLGANPNISSIHSWLVMESTKDARA